MIEVYINGVKHVTNVSAENLVNAYGVNRNAVDATIEITTWAKPVNFAPGDVYVYRYGNKVYNPEYTIVRKAGGWTDANLTDDDVRAALAQGRAYKAKVVRA